MSKLITPGDSLRESAITVGAVAFAPTSLIAFVGMVISTKLGIPYLFTAGISVLAYGLIAERLGKSMLIDIQIAPGFQAIATSQGALLDRIYTAGDHVVLKGVDGAIPVDMHGRDIDPDIIEQLTRDKIPVMVNAYCNVTIANAFLYKTAMQNPEEAVSDLLESQIRLFINPWWSTELLNQRDLLGEYLVLPGLNAATEGRHDAMREKLMQFTRSDPQGLTEDGVEDIMQKAGSFCTQVAEWGFNVAQMHVTEIDIPQRLKDAAEARAAEKDVLALEALKAEFISTLSADLIDRLGVSPDAALRQANLVLGLISVKEQIISISDLAKLTDTIGPAAAGLAKALAAKFRDKED